ncbi:MAG: multidrug effflux MFS transporter [Marinobacter sp.]|uniref:multidrug effflux MFS transporter n=1 Tax=Marinobacter sp. TaxID=50741 RepID=UPI00299E9D18|nr:multidrug effflux MFS transporter [Marinobacter sp.]MDX1634474.1 multidrug effflux MFS transporter [Marinobacter sp.]
MLALTSIWTTILLAAAVALGPLAMDMYLPALPALRDSLATSTDQVQLTLSIYMVGFALAQLICGPLADRFGRKPVMVGGFVLFALASIGCALASSIETLLLCRFLQAFGGSAGPVLGRAAVRDIYTPREAARIMAILASIMALAPAIAPTLGGLLLGSFGWPAIFLALGGYALVMAVVVAVGIPEPLAPANRQSLRLGSLWRNYRSIGVDPSFLGYTLTNAFTFGGLFAFLSGASFVLIDFLGVQPRHFGYYFALVVAGYIAGNLAAVRLGSRLPPDRIMARGIALCVAGGLAGAALAVMEVYHVMATMAPQVLFMVGVGMILPQTLAGALANFPHMAGSASALLGFIQMSLAALLGMLVGQLHSGTPLVMTTVIGGCSLATLLTYRLLVQRHPAPGFEPLSAHPA